MHKAKENANSTFSIGKTWVLDDLTAIDSFTNAVPQTAEEQQNKQRAGPTGFIVTVQKPYYWNAHTAKEKDFFIFSLIKIFKKYTGGKLPMLHGFSPAELDQLGAVPGAQHASQPTSQSSLATGTDGRRPSQEAPTSREPRTPNLPPESSRERRSRPSHERSSQERPQRRPSQERPSQERRLHSAISHPLRTTNSSDRIHLPGSFPSTESVNDPNQQPQFRTHRSESPALSQQPNFRRPGPSQSTESFRTGQESYGSARSSNERLRANGSYSSSSLAVNGAEDRSFTAVRENHGPSPLSQDHSLSEQPPALNFNPQADERPIDQESLRGGQEGPTGHLRDRSVSSIGSKYGARGPPSLHRSEPSDHVPEERRPSTASSLDIRAHRVAPPEVTASSVPPNDERATTTYPPTPPPETPSEETHRPGLGPMIRSKKSTTDVANKFRKAATAYNAFKPRAGGVGEKLPDDKTTGGDGITGVFQAPSLLRAASQNDTRPPTPKESEEVRPSTPEIKEAPSVTITASPLKAVTTVPVSSPVSVSTGTFIQKSPEPEKRPRIPEKAHEERRKKRQSDHSAKYAKILGINPSLLEGRTTEIETTLNDFGWGEERNQRNAFEELESGIRKELARVEAGSWLGAVEHNDDRTVAVSDMMDRVIAECEELDCLLTLYNVELGVRK